MCAQEGREGKAKGGSAGSGSGSGQGVVIAKWCFRCRSSLLSSHKRKEIVCVEGSPEQPILRHPPSSSLPVSPLHVSPSPSQSPTNPPHPLAGSRCCSLSTSPLSAILQPPGRGIAGSGFWHPLVQAGWVRRGLGWMGTG